jgi:hypothetical protein
MGGLQGQVDEGCQVISDRVQVHRVPFEPGRECGRSCVSVVLGPV